MTVKIDGTNTVANPAFTGADTDTGLQCGTNEVKLVTGGTARATVNSSGYVGIGTTSAQRMLHIAGGTATGLKISGNNTGSGSGDGFDIVVRNDTNGVEFIQRENAEMRFETNGTERVRIHGDGTLAVKNGILLDPGQISGSSINILDEYEEGNWTPAMNNGGWTGFTINKAKYVKVGALVFVQCYVSSLTGSGNGGALKLSGLPFLPNANGYTTGAADFGKGGKKGTYARTESNTNKIAFYYSSENSANTRSALAGSDIGSDYIIFGLTYFTDQ